MAIPGDAGSPVRTDPGAGGGPENGAAPASTRRERPVGASAPACGRASCGSPKSSSAKRRMAAKASSACGPEARTRISSPWRTPRVATAFRLRALAGPRPVVTLATLTSASKPAAVRTSIAAGRAWSPDAFSTVSLRVGPRAACAAPPAQLAPVRSPLSRAAYRAAGRGPPAAP